MPIECCICTEELLNAASRVLSTPCGHVYHTECLYEWIKKSGYRGSCPVCRAVFHPLSAIPLLTFNGMDGSTSSVNNHQIENLKRELKDTQTMLRSVVDSLTNANEELKTRDAIIERLKIQLERQDRQTYGNPSQVGNRQENSQYQTTYGIRPSYNGLSDFVCSLEDDELEFNLKLT